MDYIGTSLKIIELALEIFKDERGDRYSRLKSRLDKLKAKLHEENSKPKNSRSDLTFDNLMLDIRKLQEDVIRESSNR